MYRYWTAVLLGAALLGGCAKEEPPLKDLEVKITEYDVPDPVMAAFRNTYPNAQIRDVEKAVHPDGTVHYAIEFVSMHGTMRQAQFDPSGQQRPTQ